MINMAETEQEISKIGFWSCIRKNCKQTISNPLDYQEKFEQLVADNQKMRDEFNNQRAKLKELFLQKEGEFRKMYLPTIFHLSSSRWFKTTGQYQRRAEAWTGRD